MGGSRLRRIFFGLLCAGCLGTLCPAAGRAADCAQLLHDLSQLTGMMQRQEFLDRAIGECPDDHQINYYYAYNLQMLRRYEQALRYYEAAVRLQPDFARGYLGLGDAYLALGRNKEAIASFKKGLTLEPDNGWARRLYEKALQDEKAGGQEKPGAELKAEAAAQAPPPADVDTASSITAEDFVRSMTGDAAQRNTSGQEHVLSLQIQFEIASGELTQEAKAMLDSVVCKALQSQELQDRRFEVAGHTDDSGTPEVNMYFSKARATRVRDYLVAGCGIAADRLTAAYYGQERPAFPNTSKRNRMMNRRVEFRLLP